MTYSREVNWKLNQKIEPNKSKNIGKDQIKLGITFNIQVEKLAVKNMVMR